MQLLNPRNNTEQNKVIALVLTLTFKHIHNIYYMYTHVYDINVPFDYY